MKLSPIPRKCWIFKPNLSRKAVPPYGVDAVPASYALHPAGQVLIHGAGNRFSLLRIMERSKNSVFISENAVFVGLLTWGTVFEDDLVVRCGNHNRLFAIGFAIHHAGTQNITAFFAVECFHIVGFVQIDRHLHTFAVDDGGSVCGQALFVKAVGYFDFLPCWQT